MATLSVTKLLFLLQVSLAVYVDKGDPYQQGTLPTTEIILTKMGDHCPLHSFVILPTKPGDYAVAMFVSGLNGVFPAESYKGYLTSVAKHGIIVIAGDYLWPARAALSGDLSKDHRVAFISDTFMELFLWMKANLQGHIKGNVTNVTSNWDHAGLFCHSAGGDSIFKMAERNDTLFQSIVFYEPFSFMFTTPTNFSLPALVVGTQLSTVHHDCIIPGFGYNHFYKMWGLPPKVLMEVKGFGHCDVLDDAGRHLCIDGGFCIGGNASSIPAYHRFAQGVTSAFFIATLQGNTDDFRYIIDVKNIPLPLLEFKYNMTAIYNMAVKYKLTK